jgi:site-specific DNA-cytosine methylase
MKIVLFVCLDAVQRLYAMELFCGGGGLSYICQRNENVTIKAMWANDINNSAAATYSLNHPSAFVGSSCRKLPDESAFRCWSI